VGNFPVRKNYNASNPASSCLELFVLGVCMQENAHHPTAGTRLEPAIENDGFAITENCVDECTIDQLCATLDENTHGQRNLLGVPLVRELAASEPVRNLVEEILGPNCHAVKGIFFNKTPESNWKVAWHQDLTIAVRQRAEIAGFGPWTIMRPLVLHASSACVVPCARRVVHLEFTALSLPAGLQWHSVA
jgi:hypothetical protein